jgi:hypothetical protein
MRKTLLRFLWTAPLVLLFAGTAYAQTTGTIIGVVTDASSGKPVAGAVIIATSPQLQGEQTAVTDDKGNYRLALLPPGAYKLAVQLEGFKPAERADIQLRVDKTLRANIAVVPEAVQMEEQVVRTGTAPVVNVGSAEAGAVVSQEFIASVPLARGFEGIAVVAPTAKIDTYGISFAGAQSPENQYIIDGLNATDPVFGTRAAVNGPPALRSNFLQEVDVKTGGFSAEYGRATGGILNVVLKSGSNQYSGSVFSTFTPSFLVEPDGKAVGAAGEAIGYRTKPDEGTYGLDLGFEVGGPIMKDKLWFFAGFAPVLQKTYYERFLRRNTMGSDVGGCPTGYSATGDVHGATGQCVSDATGDYLQTTIAGTQEAVSTERQTYQWVGKLSYLFDENNTFTLTGWGAPSSRTGLGTQFFSGPMYNSPSARLVDTNDSQTSVFGRWSGKFLQKRLIGEVQAGWFGTTNEPVNKTIDGVNQFATPRIEWQDIFPIAAFEDVPAGACTNEADCGVFNYTTGGRGGNFKWTTNRFVGKASVAYLFEALGSHNLKGGIDLERIDYTTTRETTGGSVYIWLPTATGQGLFTAFRGYGGIVSPGTGPGGVPGLEVADYDLDPTRVFRSPTRENTSETDSFAYYIQNSWTPSFFPNVTVNAGLRLETQSMKNLDFTNATGFEINDNWSPRVQAVWDFTGNGRGKVAASWGRFYYAMPLDMGDRAFGQEISLRYNLSAGDCGYTGDPRAFDPTRVAAPFESATTTCDFLTRGGANNDFRLTGATLTPADSNLEGAFVDQFGAQVEYEVLPDLSVGIDYQGRRQGNVIEDMSSNDGGDYFIGNPGKDRDISADGVVVGNSRFVTSADPITGREVALEFPKPERSYDGLTFKVTKLFSRNWLASASYTYSVLRGNYPGPFRPESGQLDPGITSEYDLATLMANRTGYLPGDQTHAIKLYGAYSWSLSPRLNLIASGAYTGTSGSPTSVLGAHPDYGPSEAFVIPRGQGGRTPFVNAVDLGGGVEYTIRPPFAVNFRVDVFNVFNSQEVLNYDEDYTFDSIAPVNVSCDGSYAGKPNPGQELRNACPDVAFLKTVDGRPVTPNPNWGKAGRATTALQTPLSLRLSLALSF